ncbi:MAG: domain S-box [Mycobacterium sp.]|nr:domain S-box [Mycobacterium sp.]
MRPGVLSMLVRPTAPPLKLGLVVAASLIAVETLVLYPLKQIAPENTLGVVYLLGVVVVAIVWGFWLAAAMSVASVVAFDYFHIPPVFALSPTKAGDWVTIIIFLVVALVASTLTDLARSRAAEAHQRRKELERFFDLSSDLLCIGGSVYLTRVNAAFEQTLGYSSQEVLSRPFVDFIHPGDRDLALDVLEALSGADGPVHFEDRCICKDGSVRWLEWNVVSDQGLIYLAGRDVTERRRQQDELGVLAEQQAALRRVATLVARGVEPSKVFSAVATELARCLGVYYSALWRYEPDGTATLLAAVDDDPGLKEMPVGARFSLEGDSVVAMVLRTGDATRTDSFENAPGSAAARLHDLGLRVAVGAPIVVGGGVWGAAVVGWSRPEPLPADTEARVGDFVDLVATAIANVQAHAELTLSRARIVAAGDDARRRIERDLHDGAQQRLVSLGLQLRTAEASVPPELHPLKEQISHLVTTVAAVSKDLQEISRGIHPAILSRGGLGPALKGLAQRSTVPVELDLGVDRRLPECAEVAAYYVVAEALTNAAKYARASEVAVRVEAEGANLHLSIRDDGIGGAHVGKGSGLVGLIDRVEALGGRMKISSQSGNGTLLLVKIPLEVQ